jgi:hypothetical protein
MTGGHLLALGVRRAADLVTAAALYLRADEREPSPDPTLIEINARTAMTGLRDLKSYADLAEIQLFLRVANNEAYLRLLGALLLTWIVGNQLLTPDIALEAVAASVAALIFVLVSTAMQAHWAQGIEWRAAIEDLAFEIDAFQGSSTDDLRSIHFRRAILIVTGRLERAIWEGERSTARTRRTAWAAGQIPWLLAAAAGSAFFVLSGASLISSPHTDWRVSLTSFIYALLWSWSGYTIRRHFAPRRSTIGEPRHDDDASEFLATMRQAARAGYRLAIVNGADVAPPE